MICNQAETKMWIAIVLMSTFGAVLTDDAIGCDTYDIRQVYSPQTDEYWVYINRPITYPLLEMCIQACFTWEYKHAATTYDNMCLCSNKDGPWKPCTNGSEPLDVQVFQAVPKDESYVGCYTDKGLTWKPPGNYKSHSVDSCKEICKTNGYLYASMRRGQECQCISIQYENTARSILCNMTCQQMPNEVCGGQQHLSLYKTGLSRAAEVRYIGCYEEFDSNGQGVYNPGSFQTVEECLSECQRSNFKYSLTKQDDSACFCLYQSPWKESPEPVPESQCDATTAFYKFYFTKNVMAVASSTVFSASLSSTTAESQKTATTLLTQTTTSEATTSATESTTTAEDTTSTSTPSTTTTTTTASSTSTTTKELSTPTTTGAALTTTINTTTPATLKSDASASTETTITVTQAISTTTDNYTSSATETVSSSAAPSMNSTTSAIPSSSVVASQRNLTSATEQTTTTTILSTPSTASKASMKTPVDPSAPNVVVKASTTTSIPPGKTKSSGNAEIDSTRIIIGAVIGGLLLIVIIVFIAYVVRRARRHDNDNEKSEDQSSCFGPGCIRGKTSMVEKKYSKPIWKANLNDYVTQNMQRRNYFKEEYKNLPSGLYSKAEVGRRPENLHSKNRFKNVIPYDDTRVVLTEDPNRTDYINASYVKNYHGRRVFIAAQGPKNGTVIDFWRMIWQENVPVVVMLTDIDEVSNECANYWPTPSEGAVEYRDIKVTLHHQKKYPFHRVRNFNVQKGSVHRTVLQFQYTDWPDHGVPEAPSTLVNFYEDVQRKFDSSVGPCVVHCSAGVGRTGTFLALDFLLEQARMENKVDVMGCVYSLRKQRVNIVQTSTQYVFLHVALNHMLTLEITNVPIERFLVYFQSIRQISSDGESKLEEQYKMLESTKLNFRDDEMSDALSEINRGKNRNLDIVPRNQHRPGLETEYEGGTGYINAVAIDCYTKEHAFFVTHLPMESTRADFWCLVHDFGASVILALDCPGEDLYWPTEEDESISYGPFKVKCTAVEEMTSYITKYKLVVMKDNQALDVTLLQLDWSTDDVGPVSDLLKLYSIVHNMERAADDIFPIIIQCKTGYERSGLYCVLSNAIKMLMTEKRVDIFQCVQTARTRRPQFIKSLNQYRFIHDAIKVYISKG